MLVTLLGIVTLIRLGKLENASIPRVVTPRAIVMLVRLVHEENAAFPMR
jgi:hypothetical protein